jgi:hypothetical protein
MTDHTLNDVFQRLVRVRDIPPLVALDGIESAMKLGKLRVTYRIRGGAENYYHHTAPSEGLTGPVQPQAWRVGMMYLVIENERLVVKVKGAIAGFSWDDVSFVIDVDDWDLVDELWKPQAPQRPPKVRDKQPPRLEAQMVIAILRDMYPDGFSADDVPGKMISLAKRWGAECEAPLGDPGCKGTYKLPHQKTIGRIIKDYHERPEAYPSRRRT